MNYSLCDDEYLHDIGGHRGIYVGDKTTEDKKVTEAKSKTKMIMPRHRFQESWLPNALFKTWLARVPDDTTRAYCQVCHKHLMADITGLKYHRTSRQHVSLEERQRATSRRQESATPEERPGAAEEQRGFPSAVQHATLLFILFLAEHNLPLCDDLLELNRKMFPDSTIGAQMALKRKKCSQQTKILGEFLAKQLARKLHYKFSLIIDETTDCTADKACALVVKYSNKETNTIKTSMLDIISLYDENDGSSGVSLFNLITKTLNTYQIPFTNMVGFGADGASNIMGAVNSVSSRLKAHMPGITIVKCAAHSIHLCSSEAAKTLPRTCEELVRNVYTFFCHSAKRKYEFKEYQVFCGVKPHKILHPCATRWLSLAQAVERLLEQWQPLKLYFNGIRLVEKLSSIDRICEAMDNEAVYCYLKILNYMLPHLNRVTLVFQAKGPTLHLAHDILTNSYLKLLNYFCQPTALQKMKLNEIDPADQTIHLPINQIYLGEDVHSLFQAPNYENHKLVMEIKTT
nr:uncharacterized protein LOC113805630 [Penaeus vannamei]